ncbi:hypothetical protein EON65_38360 [archaeon]|nr:MAG: hypothetical protein EON65_38360 [archaeon]
MTNRKARRSALSREKWLIANSLDLQDVMKYVMQDWLTQTSKLKFICALPRRKDDSFNELVRSFVWTKTIEHPSRDWERLTALFALAGIANISSCKLDRYGLGLSFTNIVDVHNMFRNLQCLSLRDSFGLDLQFLAPLSNLKELTLNSMRIAKGDSSPHYLTNFLPRLSKLVLLDCVVEESMFSATDFFDRLGDLHLLDCKVEEAAVFSIIQLLPFMTQFRPCQCRQGDEIELFASTTINRRLTKLCIAQELNSPNFASTIIDRSPNLRCLDSSDYVKMSSLPLTIQELILTNIILSNEFFRDLARNCPHLVTVLYGDCDYMPSLSTQQHNVPIIHEMLPYFERLKSLSIHFMGSFTTIYKHLQLTHPYPNLQGVSFMKCDRIQLTFLVSFLHLCPRLTSLHLHDSKLGDVLSALVTNTNELTQLEELVLERFVVDEEEVNELYQMHKNHFFFSHVQRLVLRFCDLDETFIHSIIGFFSPSLVSLQLQHCVRMRYWYRIISSIVRSQRKDTFKEFIWEVDRNMPKHGMQPRLDLIWQLYHECQQKVGFVLRTSRYIKADYTQKKSIVSQPEDVLVLLKS